MFAIHKREDGIYILQFVGLKFIITSASFTFPSIEDFQNVIDAAKSRGWLR